jgi:hypothetical protein
MSKFNSAGLFQVAAESKTAITVQALLFYEGKHTDSIGKTRTYSAKKIEEVAAATNEYLAAGRRIKFFADHEYSQHNVLGSIVGEVSARTIDEAPHKGMGDIVGKLGIYATVEIAGAENVAAYSEKRLKEISVGIDFSGDSFGYPGAIYELSAVGIPALAGAALFAKTLAGTMAEAESAQAQMRVMMALDDAWYAFRSTIADIGESGEADGSAQMLQAAQDFSELLLAQFALDLPPPEELPPEAPLVAAPAQTIPTVPLFSKTMELTPEQIQELQAKAELADALQVELATVKRAAEVSAKFSALKERAIELRNSGKLTPAKFKQFGFEDSNESIAKFSAGDDLELTKLEIQLDTIEEYAQPVKMGSHLSDEPIAGEESANLDDEIKALLSGHKFKKTW